MAGNVEAFFEQAHSQFEYYGYDDIALRNERMSKVDVDNVDIRGQVSTHYSLRVPILGAPMNTISGPEMAIAMGKVGAAGVLHHCNTPEEQLAMVESVYHHLNGIIDKPWDAREGETIADVLGRLEKKEKTFTTLPVIDTEGRCVGLMDETCFQLFDSQTTIKEAMRPFGSFQTAQAGITAHQAYEIMKDNRLSVLPLLDSYRRIGGLCLVKDIMRMVQSNPKEYSLSDSGRLLTFASVPTQPEEAVARVRKMHQFLNVVIIDTSHGEHEHAIETLEALQEADFGVDIIVGNISTEQTAIELAKFDPDGIKVGQGPGQICKSSDRLGFGTPQASAVYEVSRGARSIRPDMPIIADGGIKEPADTVKALALGATAVMVGGLISGTDEAPAPVKKDENGVLYKDYYGMGSELAQMLFAAARARYGHYGPPREIVFGEGSEKRVPLKGPVKRVIMEHELGVKISMAAQGAANIKDLAKHAAFMHGSNRKH